MADKSLPSLHLYVYDVGYIHSILLLLLPIGRVYLFNLAVSCLNIIVCLRNKNVFTKINMKKDDKKVK